MRSALLERAAILLALAIVAAAVAAGCGGDGSAEAGEKTYSVEASTTMTTGSITKAQFAGRVNKLCRQAWVVVLDNWAQHTSWQDAKASRRERFKEAVQVSLLAGIDFHIFDEIREVGAPPGEAREIEAMIGSFQAAVELGWKGRWVAYSVQEITPHFEEFNRQARRYGLDDCLVDEAHLALRRIEA